jgi:hypothetical protein
MINATMPEAIPHNAEPVRKMAMPASTTLRRPYRSDSLPQIGTAVVLATR